MSTEPTNAEGSSPASSPAPAAPAVSPTPAPTPAPVAAADAPSVREIAASMTPAERRDVALGKRTLPEVLASRAKPNAAAPAQAAAPAPTPAPAAPAATEQPEPTPQPDANPDDDGTPDDPEAPSAAAPEGGKPTDRFRFKDETSRTIAMIAKAKGVSLLEAAEIFRNDPKNKAQAPAANPAEPAATPAVVEDPALKQYDADIATAEQQIAKLSEERKKAREDVDMEKADSLSDQIADLKTSLGLLKHEREGYTRQREAASARTIEQQTTASMQRLLGAFPELQDEGSLHRQALDGFVQRALADPARAREFDDPAWPEKIGREFTNKYGLKEKSGSAAPSPAPASPTPGPAPARPVATPNPAARPKPLQVPGARSMTSADGAQPSATPATAAELQQVLRQLPPAQRRRLVTTSFKR